MNPFIHNRPATKSRFLSRRRSLNLVSQAFRDGSSPLLLAARPRMGKTSLVLEAARRLGDKAPAVVRVDLTTASALADVAGRLLRGASLSTSKKNSEAVSSELAEVVGVSATVTKDPKSGKHVVGVDRSARSLPEPAQRQILGSVFDALNAMAHDHRTGVAVALEGIDLLPSIGGHEALWQLREALGRQDKLGQLLTTDDPEFADTATAPDGPFAAWARSAQLQPIRTKRMVAWIREAIESSGTRTTRGAVRDIVDRPGSRTGDIVSLAAASFDQAAGGKVTRKTVAQAFDRLSLEMKGWFRSDWTALTPRQQNLLRALAAGEIRPFAARVRRHYDLRSSAAVARSLELLIQKGLVYRSDVGYAVDNPFFRRWIQRTALPDVGSLPPR